MASGRPKPIVMLSSTFLDLKLHREAAEEAILRLNCTPEIMEHKGAATIDVIKSSLEMVEKVNVYVLIVAYRYGQVITCADNPDRKSVTELEYDRAVSLKKPILAFFIDKPHPFTIDDIDTDAVAIQKLTKFKERAKIMLENDGATPRLYEHFASKEDFAFKFATALSNELAKHQHTAEPDTGAASSTTKLPFPPALRAVPKYIASSKFVGRTAELKALSEWCRASDTDPVMLFEAIGGSGKSHLTWEWVATHAPNQRQWAGRFWYSFYEQGATMAEFVRHALAYAQGVEPAALKDLSQHDATQALLRELDAKPWLLVLDGLERVLVAYNRIDADKIDDAEAEAATDQMADRQPRRTFHPDDEDLLRALTAAVKSKILISTRLTPWALRNERLGTHNGVRVELLKGLTREDAEALFRARGVKGNGPAIQDYLQTNCGNHPLVIGALAGLVMGYLKDRGNFDKWVDDPDHGRRLSFAGLDLKQKRTQILDTAIQALTPDALNLLQIMSLVGGALDYELLLQLHAKLPDIAPLDSSIKTLEAAGLLQYDETGKNFDLHPVVRRIADSRMGKGEVDAHGNRVIDVFNARPHPPYDQAETMNDVAPGIEIMRAQLRLGRYDDAFDTFSGSLVQALDFNLSARHLILELIRPFFPNGWEGETAVQRARPKGYLLNEAAMALDAVDRELAAKLYSRAITQYVRLNDAMGAWTSITNIAIDLSGKGRLAQSVRLKRIAQDLAEAARGNDQIFKAQFALCVEKLRTGDAGADALTGQLAAMKRPTNRAHYREGEFELWAARGLFWTGGLTESKLRDAEAAVRRGRTQIYIGENLRLRAQWHLSRGEPDKAIGPLNECIKLNRQARRNTNLEEAMLALAHFRHRKDAAAARADTERLTEAGHVSLELAELWHELGERDRAIEIALKHHEWALADGEPYVFRYELDKTREFLTKLRAPLPPLRQHDPSKDERFPWEDDVEKLIAKLEAENAEKDKKKPKA